MFSCLYANVFIFACLFIYLFLKNTNYWKLANNELNQNEKQLLALEICNCIYVSNEHIPIFLFIFRVQNKEAKLHLSTPGFMLTCAKRHPKKEINGKLHFDPLVFIRH